MRVDLRYWCFVVLFCVMVFGQACASFHGNQIPKIGNAAVPPQQKLKPIDYKISTMVQGKASSHGEPFLRKIVEKEFSDSDLFESYEEGAGIYETHLNIALDNYGNAAAAGASGFISGFTFLIIPGYARDNYRLTIEVHTPGGEIRTYEYKNYMSTWIGWIFLPLTPFKFPTVVGEDIVGNMFRKFLQDIARDGLLAKRPDSLVAPNVTQRRNFSRVALGPSPALE